MGRRIFVSTNSDKDGKFLRQCAMSKNLDKNVHSTKGMFTINTAVKILDL